MLPVPFQGLAAPCPLLKLAFLAYFSGPETVTQWSFGFLPFHLCTSQLAFSCHSMDHVDILYMVLSMSLLPL